jgi:hypothetical protein
MEILNSYKVLVGKTEGNVSHWRLHIGGRVILKWTLKK